MKIALIGPVFPYRGGIAHHTNKMLEVLRRRGHEVDAITFSRQYPRFLFPGKTQEEPQAGSDVTWEGERLIDSLNPWSWWRTGRKLRERGYDTYLFQYWLPFFGPAYGAIAWLVRRRGRMDLIGIVHNYLPHESRFGDRVLAAMFFRYCKGLITQSTTVQQQIRSAFPNTPCIMQPHPIYENFGNRITQDHAKKLLNVHSKHILLFFGFIRKYKGLDLLLEAMPEILRRIPDIHLLVAGEYYEDATLYEKVIQQTGIAQHVTMHTEYVPNDEVTVWFSAADVVVLPYRSATNSGIVQIAYNFGVPAIVSNVGSLSEVVLDDMTGYVLEDTRSETIAAAVERILVPGVTDRMSVAIAGERAKYSWDALAEAIERLYHSNGSATNSAP